MSAAELLADLDRLGVRLKAHGDRLRYHPRSAVTGELVARLKAHKGDLLAMLRPAPQVAQPWPVVTRDANAKHTRPVCQCGSATWRDVPIHDGQSIRRDCGRCGTFIGFPVWYGNDTLQ